MTNPTVFDCGGRGGLHRSWQAFPFKLNYVAFEPDADEATRLAEAQRDNSDVVSYSVIPKAVSNTTGKRIIKLYEQRDLTSFYSLNLSSTYRYQSVHLDAEIEMDCTNVDTAAKDLGRRPDFLNIDVQGASLDVIQGAATVLSDMIGIRCEAEFIPLYAEAPRFDQVAHHLWSRGWKLLRIETCGDGTYGVSTDMNQFSISPQDSTPAFCDCVFINDPRLNRLLESRDSKSRRAIVWAAAYLLHNGAGFYAMELLQRLSGNLDFNACFADVPAEAAQSMAAGLAVYLKAPRTSVNAGKSFDKLVSALEEIAGKGPLSEAILNAAREKIRSVYKIS